MHSRNSELMKNTLILSIGQIIPKVIAVIVLPLLTAYLSQEDYGLYELSLSVAGFCIPLLSVQIQQGVFRYLLEQDTNKKSVITDSFFFIILIFLASAIPIIIGWTLYSANSMLAILFYCSYVFEMLLSWAGQVVRGLGNNIVYSWAYIIYSVVFVIILTLFVFVTGDLKAENVAIAMIVAYGVSFMFLMFKQRIYKYVRINALDKNVLKMLLSYSGPMVISSVSLWIVNLSDRLFVSAYFGIETTAVYGVANRIPNLFNSMYNIFNLAWTENTSKLSKKEKDGGYYSNFFKEFYQVMVGMMILLISISPLLFKVLVSNKYASAYSLMSWLYVGAFFSSIVAFFGSIYVGEMRTKDVGISSAIGAVLNVLINLVLMRRFGVIVAAISTIVSYFIICIYRAYDIKRYVLISYDLKSVISGLAIVIIVAALNNSFSIQVTVVSVLITIIYNWIYNRNVIMRIILSLLKR